MARKKTYIVIKEEQPLLRLHVPRLQELARDVRRHTRQILRSQLREQQLGQRRAPRLRGVRRDNLVQLRVPQLLLGGGHCQPVVHRGCHFLHI